MSASVVSRQWGSAQSARTGAEPPATLFRFPREHDCVRFRAIAPRCPPLSLRLSGSRTLSLSPWPTAEFLSSVSRRWSEMLICVRDSRRRVSHASPTKRRQSPRWQRVASARRSARASLTRSVPPHKVVVPHRRKLPREMAHPAKAGRLASTLSCHRVTPMWSRRRPPFRRVCEDPRENWEISHPSFECRSRTVCGTCWLRVWETH